MSNPLISVSYWTRTNLWANIKSRCLPSLLFFFSDDNVRYQYFQWISYPFPCNSKKQSLQPSSTKRKDSPYWFWNFFLLLKKKRLTRPCTSLARLQLKIKLYNILQHIFLKMYICKLKILFYNVLDDSIGREEAQLAMRKAGKLLQSFHFA